MRELQQEIVLSGEWLYDGTAPMPVHIVRMNYDYWYELAKAEGRLELGEKPDLNEEGCRYYLLFSDKPGPPWWPDESGGASVAEAKRRAETALPSEVQWREEPSV